MYSVETIKAINDCRKLADIIRKKKLDKLPTGLEKVVYFDMFLRGAFGQSFPIYREQKDYIVRDMRYMQDSPYATIEMRELMQSISLNL